MLRLVYIILFVFIFSTFSNAQNAKYKDGYVILNSGDTIKGEIQLLLPITYSQAVVFRERGTKLSKTYSPDELLKFYFENSNYYQSDSIPFKTLNNGIYYKRLFIKKLLTGDIELFRLDFKIRQELPLHAKNEDQFYFYREKRNDQLIDLLESNYKEKIKAAFNKYECELNKKLNYRFNDVGLTNLVSEYNRCRGGESENTFVVNKNIEERTSIGLSTGIASSRLQTTNSIFEEFKLADNRTLAYDINVFGKLEVNKRLFVRAGLNFKNRSYTNSYELIVSDSYDNEGDILTIESNITINQLSVPIEILFHFNKKRTIRPYIFAGGSFGIKIKNTSYAEQELFKNIDGKNILTKYEVTPFNSSINHFEFNLIIGGGIEYFVHKKTSVFIESKWTNSRNDASKDSNLYIFQDAVIVNVGINHILKRPVLRK